MFIFLNLLTECFLVEERFSLRCYYTLKLFSFLSKNVQSRSDKVRLDLRISYSFSLLISAIKLEVFLRPHILSYIWPVSCNSVSCREFIPTYPYSSFYFSLFKLPVMIENSFNFYYYSHTRSSTCLELYDHFTFVTRSKGY